jgi:hypothetical protein
MWRREQNISGAKLQSKTLKPWLVFLGGIAIFSAGCHSNVKLTDENLKKGLNAYYSNHNDCLFPSALRFPYEVSPGTDSKERSTQMEALADAGLVTRKEDKSIKVSVYSLTPIGERVGGRFCYGHREVTTIDSFTPPEKGDSGFIETKVTYHYQMRDVPVWAKTDKMQSAFPDMAKALSGQATGTAKLANAGVGWQVPS